MGTTLELETEKFGFKVSRNVSGGDILDDIIIKTKNGYRISLKKLLRDLGEL